VDIEAQITLGKQRIVGGQLDGEKQIAYGAQFVIIKMILTLIIEFHDWEI